MKYSKENTLLHPIAQKYPSCVKDLNLIIRKDLKSSPELFTEVKTIDLDKIQEERAIELRKDKDSSVDTCFVVSNGSKKVILVELKLGIIYKQQNRGYKSDKKWKSTETLINKGLEAKKHQNRDKTKCTKGYIYMQKMSRNNAPNCTRIGRIYLLHG